MCRGDGGRRGRWEVEGERDARCGIDGAEFADYFDARRCIYAIALLFDSLELKSLQQGIHACLHGALRRNNLSFQMLAGRNQLSYLTRQDSVCED